MIQLVEYIKGRLKKESQLSRREYFKKMYDIVVRNIIQYSKTRDLLDNKLDKKELTEIIERMKQSKKILKKQIKKEEKRENDRR